jgi:hypothetical protein
MRDWKQRGKIPSSNTGAYNQSRQTLPQLLVEQSYDHMFEQMIPMTDPSCSGPGPRAFLLDGSTVRMPHTPELCRHYPPGSNQHGEGHFPILRVLVAHDLYTGLAMRPEFGPVHGPDAVSEQQLLEAAITRLPGGSILLGDSNFGVFSVAYTGAQSNHPVLLRLTTARAQHLHGGPLRDGIDRPVQWKASRWDRSSHPDLPAGAGVQGRLIVRQVQPDNGAAPFLLCLFTTLPGCVEEALNLYGQRWNIETDLRTLKSTLQLDQLTCRTPEMVAKEITMGMAAYNLVRAVICQASKQSGISPRGYSFTKVRRIVEIFAPQIESAPNPEAAKQVFDQMMQCIQQAKLPRRQRKRSSYPRHVWKPRNSYPTRKN